jgi:hypothetical protein
MAEERTAGKHVEHEIDPSIVASTDAATFFSGFQSTGTR